MKIINEVVFADRQKINDKKKTIGLTYQKGNRAENNANPFDKLGTEEMDQENANTIEIPLKGGLISYNITDIKGTEVMHYFKKKWAQNQRVDISIKKNDGNQDSYELQMDNKEEREFIDNFVHKVELVVKSWIDKNKKQNLQFSKISILPVDSTSDFNKVFVRRELSKLRIYGLDCQVVDPKMIVKDARDIQRDEEFIKNNSKFYDGNYSESNPEMGTINQRVDNVIVKNKALESINNKIDLINSIAKKLIIFLNNNKKTEALTDRQIDSLTANYKKYVDTIRECYLVSYISAIDNDEHTFNKDKVLRAIKYSKGPSIDNRSRLLWNMVKGYLRGQKSKVDNMRYEEEPLCMWNKSNFEIKKLRNSERLGLKNIYNTNREWDEKRIKEELSKIKGTILLIFDDNISGGATLSDVCLQCKNLGIDNIIPITFGKMSESNTMRGLTLNTPEGGYNFSTDNNLSLYSGDKKDKRKYLKKDDALNKGKELFYKTHNINESNPMLNILWLDDIREPYSYFSTPRNSGAWNRNNEYYSNNVFSKYNPNFIWVKNLKEFQNYILNNGMPNMVSFDHDIAPRNYSGKHENGEDIARWFVDYCHKNNIELPWTFVHSANEKGGYRISEILKGGLKEGKNVKVIKIRKNDLKEIINEAIIKAFNEII